MYDDSGLRDPHSKLHDLIIIGIELILIRINSESGQVRRDSISSLPVHVVFSLCDLVSSVADVH